nr:mitochondrial cardiolipin hydrolase-like [Rhipicephalus microplus]
MRVADVLAVAFGVSVLTEVAYFIYIKVTAKKKRHLSKKAAAFGNQVIFFPDRGVACPKATHDDSDTCGNPQCCFLHGRTSLRTLVHTLTSAERTLDVCVYMITCDTLGDAIIGTHQRGRAVRVITEAEGSDTPGSQIGRLREAGIPVRVNNHSSFLMHHKFALVDRELLISGSFNWTRQAITGNHENLIMTSEPDLVDSYTREFTRLWELFKPRPVQNNVGHHNADVW